MSSALYRKYRPQSFADIVGQNHIKTTLQSELETDRVAHAFLFSGPRGLGKTSTARIFAKAINCQKRKAGTSEPCNDCDACREIAAGTSFDVLEIDAASNTGVDNVRENIINNSKFTPARYTFKVFIIDEVHMLSVSAFNALLKTLEEPPAHVVFILATTEIHKVPETIISRCQHFNFKKVAAVEIMARLKLIVERESRTVDDAVLVDVAHFSQGCLRDAESMLGQLLSLGGDITIEQAALVVPRRDNDAALEWIEFLNRSDAKGAILLVNKLVDEGVDMEHFAAQVVETIRQLIMTSLGNALSGNSLEYDKKLQLLAEKTSLDFLVRAADVVMEKNKQIRYAEIPQLPLELAALQIIDIYAIKSNHETRDGDSDKGDDSSLPIEGTQRVVEKNTTREKPVKKTVIVTNETVSEEHIPVVTKTGVLITIDSVRDKWNHVLTALEKHHHTLAHILRISRPEKVDGNGVLEIHFEHRFHQQRIDDSKNRQMLEKILEEVLGGKVIVKTLVRERQGTDEPVVPDFVKKQQQGEDLSDLIDTFGGQVV